MEHWKPVFEFELLYEVSNMGRVRSRERAVRCVSKHGTESHRLVRSQMIRPWLKDGYQMVKLCANGQKCVRKIARLVAQAFIPNPGARPEVNHIKGKSSDRVSNLEWNTRLENNEHAYANRLLPSGSRHRWAKLNTKQVTAIRKEYASGRFTQEQIAARHGVKHQTVSDIVRRKKWKHTGGQ